MKRIICTLLALLLCITMLPVQVFAETEDAESAVACVDADAAEEMAGYPTRYYTGHCTGLPQYEFLKERMGDRLQYISTGDVIEI